MFLNVKLVYSLLKNLADNKQAGSLADRLRKKRFRLFLNLLAEIPTPIKIIDVGGTELFWERMGFINQQGISVTILNLNPPPPKNDGFTAIKGDARNIKQFADKEFDIAFSNSVIEHVGDYKDQKMMADEMSRIGKKVFIQTPNRYFPLEPHFLFPFFQFFPLWLKVRLVMNFEMGWYEKAVNKSQAVKLCNSIRLLNRRELQVLFPEANIVKEKYYCFTKSFIAVVNK